MEEFTAHSAIPCKCFLGEGPVWHEGAFWWVNIEGKTFHRREEGASDFETWAFAERIGFAVPASDGRWAIGLQSGIHLWSPDRDDPEMLFAPEENLPNNRFNDGKADPHGRLWAGTMSTKGEGPTGSLYRCDGSAHCRRILEKVTVSNGLAWNVAAGKMYYIDTPTREVAEFNYDNETGGITNRRVAVRIAEETGSPDGMTIDENGHLWIALWGGCAVIAVDPSSGETVARVNVPAPKVTSCTFGGANLDTLYITTARAGAEGEALERFPEAGNVFTVKPGTRGRAVDVFQL